MTIRPLPAFVFFLLLSPSYSLFLFPSGLLPPCLSPSSGRSVPYPYIAAGGVAPFAAKVITDLQAQIKGLKNQLNLYRWGMVVVAIGLAVVLFGR